MPAGLGVGQHVAEERALGDLQALLVLLQQLALGGHLLAGRQLRNVLGRRVDELVGAQRAARRVSSS